MRQVLALDQGLGADCGRESLNLGILGSIDPAAAVERDWIHHFRGIF